MPVIKQAFDQFRSYVKSSYRSFAPEHRAMLRRRFHDTPEVLELYDQAEAEETRERAPKRTSPDPAALAQLDALGDDFVEVARWKKTSLDWRDPGGIGFDPDDDDFPEIPRDFGDL